MLAKITKKLIALILDKTITQSHELDKGGKIPMLHRAWISSSLISDLILGKPKKYG